MTEKLKIPQEVIDSDWRDDIALEPYEREAEYISPTSISKESIEKIKSAKLLKRRGNKILNLFMEKGVAA